MNTKDQVVKNREVGLKKLYMLSKVAARKEVARDRLEKMAFVIFPTILLVPATIAGLATLYGITTQILYPIFKDISGYFFSQQVSKLEFEKSPGNDFFKKVMGIDIGAWVQTNDPENLSDFRAGSYNYIKAVNAYVKKLAEIAQEKNFDQSAPSLSQHSNSNGQQKDSFDWSLYTGSNSDGQQTTRREPSAVKRPKSSSPDLSEITRLLIKASYGNQINPNAAGWNGLDAAFRSAVADYIKLNRSPITLNDGWQWSEVASKLKFASNLTGAEKLVEDLISLKDSQGAPSPAPSAAPAIAPTPTPAAATDYTAGAKSKLTQLFNAILAGSIKVDKVGLDLRRDTMIFKGVIEGLGGPDDAVNYVFSNINFSPEQLKEISVMNLNSNQKITVSALALVRNRFMEIRIESTRGIRDNAFNAKSLAKAVSRWKSRQQPAPATSTPAQTAPAQTTQASIMRAIEIRKMAARKKLGI